jgi:argininosuccinate synthase
MKKKVVLAFSGGLDTSYCVKYLSQEKNLDVFTAIVNTGAFSKEELAEFENKAIKLGTKGHQVLDVTVKYYHKCIRYLIYGNILKNSTYPLSVSSERVFQAMALAEYAKSINADFIAHGSTGAGNDQIRFDMIFNILIPGIEILTPIRDQELSRKDEINYLSEHGYKLNWKQSQYSINKGLWGTSVGGKETLTSYQALPDEAYPTPISKKEKLNLDLVFDKGQFTGFNNSTFKNSIEAIKALNKIVAPYGIGRDIHVGDTIIGIKGRVAFEAAAPILIIKSHQALEKHTQTKWQIHWKDQLANWYGLMLHEGHFLDPVMRDIEVYLENSQKTVNGIVHLTISPNYFQIKGINSLNDLMSTEFGVYGESNLGWSGEDARGFAKINSTQSKIFLTVNKELKND